MLSAISDAFEPDRIIRAVSASGGVSVKVVSASHLVRLAASRHGCSPVASAALGRGLMGAALMAAGSKGDITTQLHVRGEGPLKVVCAEAVAPVNGPMRLRGFVQAPEATVALKADGQLDVGRAVGLPGFLRVSRIHPAWKSPYVGSTELHTAEIAEDLAFYMLQSEQVASAVGLGVFVSADGAVSSAAGFLCALLPGCSESELEILERNVLAMPPPSDLSRRSLRADDVVARLLEGLGQQGPAMEEQLELGCSCRKADIIRTFSLLAPEETEEIIRKGEDTPTKCEWCGQVHIITTKELEETLIR